MFPKLKWIMLQKNPEDFFLSLIFASSFPNVYHFCEKTLAGHSLKFARPISYSKHQGLDGDIYETLWYLTGELPDILLSVLASNSGMNDLSGLTSLLGGPDATTRLNGGADLSETLARVLGINAA
ncbi:hypothetical protein INT43_007590 [Umbelopsis isabellina]|uniref:Uncharacterized protein n=1 Tax=Mortierella isabellina TaxID=91625 RepID=A0A8H7PN17_MORIS|nr:hypothetical protein INT43_007590 [Umbelopsis isabellina]